MALDKSPEMEGLTPAERAALYKQRASAAGIGRPPSAASGTPAAAPAAAVAPAAAAPAAPPATRPVPPAAPAERPAGAGVPAKVVATAVARREQVAAVAAREGPPPSAKEQAERLVYVWPHLVTIEFLSAMLLLVTIVVISVVLQAPLDARANADRTPNPSKAPWYFLNLQELLLHMHPALAGVLIPGGVVFAAIPLIPYIDRNTADVGKWFGTRKAVPICVFTFIYTVIVEIGLVLFDEFVGVKPLLVSIERATGQAWLIDPNPLGIGALSMTNVIVPLFLMLFPIFVLILLLRLIFKPDGMRDYMLALFTGFVASYVLLTIVGTFFRGQGMRLLWPWDPRQARID